eukprot:TRINITY_DN18035_c0_g1_i1.p3 TRINITY_DN18035_c0_g1~~TRINITY_DN18035_c0_g1_i1.p3  ORF type:complete len:184 (+),score=43.09 TRINITY_DN18035_c0_g1_i1:73-624(+)
MEAVEAGCRHRAGARYGVAGLTLMLVAAFVGLRHNAASAREHQQQELEMQQLRAEHTQILAATYLSAAGAQSARCCFNTPGMADPCNATNTKCMTATSATKPISCLADATQCAVCGGTFCPPPPAARLPAKAAAAVPAQDGARPPRGFRWSKVLLPGALFAGVGFVLLWRRTRPAAEDEYEAL